MWWVLGAVLLLWIAVNLKSSRPDGTLVPDVHPYRRMLNFVLPTRTESFILFDAWVNAEPLQRFIAKARERVPCDVTHCVVAAAAKALHEHPRLNRFVAGRRLYQRPAPKITFAALRKKRDNTAKLGAVTTTLPEGQPFGDLCAKLNAHIGEQRSDKRTYHDREYDLFLKVPRPVLNLAIRALKWADYHNLLPASFVANDPFFVSITISSLGSLGMEAAYHHNWEWGTCPLFLVIGKLEERPAVVDGQVVAQPQLHLRFTYDQRIDDGLNAGLGVAAMQRVLEHPFEELGLPDAPAPQPGT